MNELLPCPFCGGEPEMLQIGRNKIKIKCKGCLVTREQKVLRYSIEWLKEFMTTWWNKRISLEFTTFPAPEKTKESVTHFTEEYDDENPDYIKGSEDGI